MGWVLVRLIDGEQHSCEGLQPLRDTGVVHLDIATRLYGSLREAEDAMAREQKGSYIVRRVRGLEVEDGRVNDFQFIF